MPAKLIRSDEVAVVNCAGCRTLLHGENQAARFVAGELKTLAFLPPPVARRVNGRPLCADCSARFEPYKIAA